MATENLTLGRAWDEDFHGWIDELLLGRKIKKPRQSPKAKSSWTAVDLKTPALSDYPGRGTQAEVRARLFALARGGQQVMVKITGSSKNAKSIKRHLDYLSRQDELELTDQDGNAIHGDDARRQLTWAWEHTGPKLDETSQRKEAFHIVFSMPEGTDARALAEAVKATAGVEFAGHQWVMVQHFDEPHVHAHVVVKAEGFDGRRLNPRKADLARWRERFAHELRERGVAAEATKRASRMKQRKLNKPWAVTRLEERGEPTYPMPAATDAAKARAWEITNTRVVATLGKVTDALVRSPDAEDRRLAQELNAFLAQQTKHGIPEPVRQAPALER